MTPKSLDYRSKVMILSSLIAALGLTALLGLVFSQQAVSQRQAQEPLLANFQTGNVTGLQVGSDLVLTKSTGWALAYQGKAYAASSDRAESYLKTLSTLSRERLVTREGDGQAFGLAQGFKTLKVLGAGGSVLYELQVGGTNDLGDKAYVRLAGQKEIWQTDRGFARTLDLDFNTWADLSLFPGKKDGELTRITFDSRIETAEKTVYPPFDLVKTTKDGQAVWEDRLSKASTEPMASWAKLVPTFHAGAFVAPNETVPSRPLGTLTLSWSDGTTTTVTLGAPDDQGRYRANVAGAEYWINDWALGQILFK